MCVISDSGLYLALSLHIPRNSIIIHLYLIIYRLITHNYVLFLSSFIVSVLAFENQNPTWYGVFQRS